MLVQKVFDGSGPDALTLVTAVIGEARDGKDAAGGEPQRQWPVSLAYFRLDDAAAEGVVDRSARDMLDAGPDFEISFTLGSGGVLQDVVLDYGDFAMRGVLEDIEVFTPPTCE